MAEDKSTDGTDQPLNVDNSIPDEPGEIGIPALPNQGGGPVPVGTVVDGPHEGETTEPVAKYLQEAAKEQDKD